MPSSVADLAALGKLLQDHHPKLLAMIQRRLDPALQARIDAEDVLSEAFLQAQRRWRRFRTQAIMTPYAWLYRIVLDTLIEVWRRHRRTPRDIDLEMPWPERSSVQLGLGLVSPDTSPSEAVARRDVQEQMRSLPMNPDYLRSVTA